MNKKISLRQTSILLFLMTLSPTIRLIPLLTSGMAGKAGWFSPIISIIPFLFLIMIVYAFYQKNKGASLADLFFLGVGKIAGIIILILYLLWMTTLMCLYMRYYTERVLSSMMPNIPVSFLIWCMLIFVFYASQKGIVTMARASEIFFYIFIGILFVIIIFSVSQVKYSNIMNISYLDILPTVKSTVAVFPVWGFYIYLFFLGDKIDQKDKIKLHGYKLIILMVVSCTLILMITIGSLGSTLSNHVSSAFFIVVRNISVGNIGHIESIILGLWIIADFVNLTIFTFLVASIIKSIFKLSNIKTMISPILIYTGIGCLFLFHNRFELENFSRVIYPYGNILFEYILPSIILIIGKFRKKI